MATWDEVEVLSATTSHARDKQKEKDFDPLETLLQGKKILRLKISRYYSDPHSPEPQDRSCKSKIANNSDYCHYRVRGRCTTSMRVTRRRHVALRTGYLASLRWSVTIGKRDSEKNFTLMADIMVDVTYQLSGDAIIHRIERER
ncbi:hypothetical protein JHK84_035905 [Glycine max]|nr:hypothetical protein JHK84_035905 [Glycine max]